MKVIFIITLCFFASCAKSFDDIGSSVTYVKKAECLDSEPSDPDFMMECESSNIYSSLTLTKHASNTYKVRVRVLSPVSVENDDGEHLAIYSCALDAYAKKRGGNYEIFLEDRGKSGKKESSVDGFSLIKSGQSLKIVVNYEKFDQSSYCGVHASFDEIFDIRDIAVPSGERGVCVFENSKIACDQ